MSRTLSIVPLARRRRLTFERLERRQLLASVAWDGGGGDLNWNNRFNWSADALPGVNDDVTIDRVEPAPVLLAARRHRSAVSKIRGILP